VFQGYVLRGFGLIEVLHSKLPGEDAVVTTRVKGLKGLLEGTCECY